MRVLRTGFLVSWLVLSLSLGSLTPTVASALTRPIDEYRPPLASRLLDRSGRELAWFGPVHRTRLQHLPRFFAQAVVATEDRTFFHNRGVDLAGILRAALHDLREGRPVEGGSGITQQLARNLYLQGRSGFRRKVAELVLALRLTRHFSKEEILRRYLETVYFGHGAYGAEAAAETYFARRLDELRPDEWALLAGLLQAPSRYDPFTHLEAALRRRRQVLARLVAVGQLRPADAQALNRRLPRLACRLRPVAESGLLAEAALTELGREAPAVVEAVRAGRGLAAVLTIDRRRQEALEEELRRLPGREKAGVILEATTGRILAMVGGDETTNRFNRAIYGRRPIASLAKPLVYAAALEDGRYTLDSVLMDEALSFAGRSGPYQPQNYDGQHHGPLRLREALATSNNVVAVRLLALIGIPRVEALARRLGLAPFGTDLTAALGTSAHSPLAVARAYAAFANYGLQPTPHLVERVDDASGATLYEALPQLHRVLSPAIAYQLATALQATAREGTAAGLGLEPLAVKTGTSERNEDTWIVGMTPRLVAVLWARRPEGWSTASRQLLGPRLAALLRRGVLSPLAGWEAPEGVRRFEPAHSPAPSTRAAEAAEPPPRPVARAEDLIERFLRRFRPSGSRTPAGLKTDPSVHVREGEPPESSVRGSRRGCSPGAG